MQSENFQCSGFGLPSPSNRANDLYEEDKLKFKKECETLFEEYHNDQIQIFSKIISGEVNNLIFIDGPGGTGKTFLYKTLIYYFISNDKNVLSMAWTGIASILLPKEIVDATLKDLCQEDHKPFAGKIIVLGGDFRQILPVVKNGTSKMIIEETIKYSKLRKNF